MREGTQQARPRHLHGGLAERTCAAKFGTDHCDSVAATRGAKRPPASLGRGRYVADGRAKCLQETDASFEIGLGAVTRHKGARSVHERAATGMKIERVVIAGQ